MKLNDWFTDESKWCKGVSALVNRQKTGISDLGATARCLSAAISHHYSFREYFEVARRLINSMKELGYDAYTNYEDPVRTIIHFNDHEHIKFEDIKKVVEHSKL